MSANRESDIAEIGKALDNAHASTAQARGALRLGELGEARRYAKRAARSAGAADNMIRIREIEDRRAREEATR